MNGGSVAGTPGLACARSHDGAACSPDSPGMLVEGAGFTAGKSSAVGASDGLDFASES